MPCSELGKIGLGGGSLLEGADVAQSKARIHRIFKGYTNKLRAVGLFLKTLSRGIPIDSLRLDNCQLR